MNCIAGAISKIRQVGVDDIIKVSMVISTSILLVALILMLTTCHTVIAATAATVATDDSTLQTHTTGMIPNTLNVTHKYNFEVKVAVVDVDAILEQSMAVRQIKATIADISQKIQIALTKQEIGLKSYEESLIRQRGVINEDEFNRKVSNFNTQVQQAQQQVQKQKSALEQAHTDAMSVVHKNTINIIKELAEQYKFNLVLPSSQILLAQQELNITAEVIQRLNEVLQSVKLNYTYE